LSSNGIEDRVDRADAPFGLAEVGHIAREQLERRSALEAVESLRG